MFLTRISVNHPVFATMMMVALVVLGLVTSVPALTLWLPGLFR